MKILLFTKNHVVREFVELATDRVGAKLYTVETLDEAKVKEYDFVFVDDRGAFLSSNNVFDKFPSLTSIVLYNKEKDLHDRFDIKLKKPFLPSDIQEIIEGKRFAQDGQQTYFSDDQVLNLQDIGEIKSLLEDEGLEIVSEKELADEVGKDSAFQVLGTEHMDKTDEIKDEGSDKILKAISEMEAKKIRKLLKGAEVTITIRFPKESQ
ncbi:MAG: hypothetical protein HF962_05030 [Sulfurovum sp.]|nr:hypothetical protein [Sulfurovum sp.]